MRSNDLCSTDLEYSSSVGSNLNVLLWCVYTSIFPMENQKNNAYPDQSHGDYLVDVTIRSWKILPYHVREEINHQTKYDGRYKKL